MARPARDGRLRADRFAGFAELIRRRSMVRKYNRMRSRVLSHWRIGGFAAGALLAGCSGSATAASQAKAPAGLELPAVRSGANAVARTPSVLPPGVARVHAPDASAGFAEPDAAAKAAFIVSDSGSNDVYVYTAAGKRTATITGFGEPEGLAVDANGNLFVADTVVGYIYEYSSDYRHRIATLDDWHGGADPEHPSDVDVAPSGLVGVANLFSAQQGVPGSVTFYPKGATEPCVTVRGSRFAFVYFGAFDAGGNFYVDGIDRSDRFIAGLVTGGCAATTIQPLATGNDVSFPGGVHVTPAGKIAIDDQLARTIYTYDPPKNGSFGMPIATTRLPDPSAPSFPVTFSFTKSTADLYTVDPVLAHVNAYAYPAGGSPLTSFKDFSQPVGIVAVPPEKPEE
jgi:hypothetical protein